MFGLMLLLQPDRSRQNQRNHDSGLDQAASRWPQSAANTMLLHFVRPPLRLLVFPSPHLRHSLRPGQPSIWKASPSAGQIEVGWSECVLRRRSHRPPRAPYLICSRSLHSSQTSVSRSVRLSVRYAHTIRNHFKFPAENSPHLPV